MRNTNERLGFILGSMAVSCFAFTLPMSHVAVSNISPLIVGFGRGLVASVIAIGVVVCCRMPWPTRQDIKPLLLTGLGVTIAFPFLSSLAMSYLPASHGAIVTGMLPLATAGWIAWQHHERPSKQFWFAALVGSLTVIVYAFLQGGGKIVLADFMLLACVFFGGMGYAEGGKLAQRRGGIFVMTWALVLMMPVLFIIVISQWSTLSFQAPFSNWLAFSYLCLVSQYGGMILWYKALSRGSIAKLSQVQLLQPFLTILVAHLLFHEEVTAMTYSAAFIVIGCILIARQSTVKLKA